MNNSNQLLYRQREIQSDHHSFSQEDQQLVQTVNLHLDLNSQQKKFRSQFVQYLVGYCVNSFGYQDPELIRDYFLAFQAIETILQKFTEIITKRTGLNHLYKDNESENETYKALQQLKRLNQETEMHYKQTLEFMWLEQDKQRKIIKKKQHLIDELQNQLFGYKENLQRAHKYMLQKTLQFQQQKQTIIQQFKNKLKFQEEKNNQQAFQATEENIMEYSQTRQIKPNQFFSHGVRVNSPKSPQSAFINHTQKNASNVFGFPSSINRNNMKKKSAFDFSPCKKKWIQSKIHLDQLTESEQIQAYKKQIQKLKKIIAQLKQKQKK